MSIQSRPKASQLGAYENRRWAIEGRNESGRRRVWSEASNSPNPQNFPDEDPPFFLRNPSASSIANIPPLNRATNDEGWSSASGGIVYGNMDSTVRSIIDDLTVENKLLRARNKSLERREKYNKEIDKDKLFEVSLYNISPSDARELEDILSAFVRSRNVTHESPRPQLSKANIQSSLAQFPYNDSSRDITQAALPKLHAAQSGASSNKLDSGYASMTPDPTSTSLLNNISSVRRPHATPASNANPPHSNDVPSWLLPRHARPVTERSKKKMVVQRLEELFTGKKLLRPRNTSQNQDRKDNVRGLVGHGQEPIPMEGSREANIMMHTHSAPPKDAFEAAGEQQETESAAEDMDSDDKPRRQRPTRLLDLDPERQQIPSENVDYLRHLGMPTPNIQKEDSLVFGPDAHGWVYLNLLMNMAQLHMMNVTVDFVRDAVEEVSSKFQLSSDGRRIRWRGGSEPTELSSISGNTTTHQSATDSESAAEIAHDHVYNVKQKAADESSSSSEVDSMRETYNHGPRLMRGRMLERGRPRHRAHYSPIFLHPSNQNSDSSDSLGTSSSGQVAVRRKRSMATNSRHVPPAKKRKSSDDRHREIAFYNNASFFVDVGGDVVNNRGRNRTFDYADCDCYEDDRSVLGCKNEQGEPDPSSWSLSSQYLATQKSWNRLSLRDSILRSPEPGIPPASDSYFDYDFDTRTSDTDGIRATPLLKFPIQMEASCLGCILPADHFLETVTTQIDSSRDCGRPRDESNSLLQGGSASSLSPRSTFKPTQDRRKEHDLEEQWQRIQARMANLLPQAKINVTASSNCPEKLFGSEDSCIPISDSVPPFSSLPTNTDPRCEAIVTRKILDVTFQQLEPSPQPPPGVYFSESGQSTEGESGSGSSRESSENFDPRYSHPKHPSRNHQATSKFHERVRGRSGNATGSAGVRRPSAKVRTSSNESSGVGEEEDDEDDDESMDMLSFAREADPRGTSLREKEWEIQKAQEMERDNDGSLEAVGWSEDSGDATSVEEEDQVSDMTRGSRLSKDASSEVECRGCHDS